MVVDSAAYPQPRAIFPDVRVYQDREGTDAAGEESAAAVAEQIVLELETEEETETYITILDSSGGQLITALEFLSPRNKLPGDARDQYRRKRDELASARINLVEIDLVRAGRWRELLSPLVAPALVQTAYRVIIRRFSPKPRAELYPVSLRHRLPRIPIPLRAQDRDVILDLNPLVEQAYREGRYDRTDYGVPCQPPLDGEDAAWAEGLPKAKG